jgi:fatty-acid desaturase
VVADYYDQLICVYTHRLVSTGKWRAHKAARMRLRFSLVKTAAKPHSPWCNLHVKQQAITLAR